MNACYRKVIVVGAGGHARVIVSLLGLMPDIEVVGVADRNLPTSGEAVGNTSVVAAFDALPEWLHKGVSWAILAIGDNRERSDLAAKVKAMGFSLLTATHPKAIVEPDVRIGEGTVVCAGAILCAGVAIGPGVIINTGSIVDHETNIGAYAHIGPGSCLAGRVTVGARTFVGAGTRVIDKITIGADCTVGAGSVVLADLPDKVVAYGIPAEVRRSA